MNNAYIPYGAYWSTPFAKWQGSLGHLHSMKLAANVARDTLSAKKFPMEVIDLGILGITNPQPSSFYGLPWVTGMIGIPNVPGPTVSQACATSGRTGIGGLRAHGDRGSLFEWRNARLSQSHRAWGHKSHRGVGAR